MIEERTKKSLLSQWKQRLKEDVPKGVTKAPEGTLIVPSHGQQRLWFLQQLNPENPFYNHSETYTFWGELHKEHLKSALTLIFKAHDVLRSTYVLEGGQLRLNINRNATLKIEEIDLSSFNDSECDQRLKQITNSDARKPFDLSKGPLMRTTLIKKSEKEHCLFLTLHHIVGDRWSLKVFNEQLASYYSRLSSGMDPEIEVLPVQYQDFAHWQLTKTENEKQLQYWKKKLSGEIPRLEIPKDFKAPLKTSFGGASIKRNFSLELSKKVLALTKDLATTPYVLMLSVYYILLSKYTGQKDILVGSPISNRDHKVLENLMGFFNDTVVLRTKLNSEMTCKELVALVRLTTLEAFENKDVPFEHLVKALKPRRSAGINPFFDAMFLYNSTDSIPKFGAALQVESETFDTGTSKFDLTLFITEKEGILSTTFEFKTSLFAEQTIARMHEHLELLLNGIIENPDRPIAEIPMFTKEESTIFFQHGQREDTLSNSIKPIHKYIEEIAKTQPQATALAYKQNSISYHDFDSRAIQIANSLITKTKGENKIVALYMDRSAEMIIGMLGILKAGCAYLPIDPDYPESRISFMLEDADADILLCHNNSSAAAASYKIDILNIDDLNVPLNADGANLPEVNLEDIAYVIYTSGSTGKPKGVPISHRNISNSTMGRTAFYGKDPKSFLLLSSIAFDSSKAGIFWTLCTGGTLVISEKRMEQDIELLSKTIKENSISHTLLLPSLYQMVLDNANVNDLSSLETVMVAGEACSNLVCRTHFDRLPQTGLYNEYGPTEATVWCVAHRIVLNDAEGSIPIGKAVAGAGIHILDDNFNLVPFGAVGELCISGEGLTTGYINLEEDTREKFKEIILDPSSRSKTRIYRTGDLARYSNNGNIEFLGRKDQQVKVRGFRIELNEIENAITKSEAVEKAIVLAEGKQGSEDFNGIESLELEELLAVSEEKIGLAEINEILKSVENLEGDHT